MSASDQRHKKQNQHRQKLKTDGRGCQRRHGCHLGAFPRTKWDVAWLDGRFEIPMPQNTSISTVPNTFRSVQQPLLFIEQKTFGPASGIGRFGAAIGRTCEKIPWPPRNFHPIPRPRSETHQLWLWLLLLHWSRCLLVEMTVLLNHLAPGASNQLPRVVLQSKTSTLAEEEKPRTKNEKI